MKFIHNCRLIASNNEDTVEVKSSVAPKDYQKCSFIINLLPIEWIILCIHGRSSSFAI